MSILLESGRISTKRPFSKIEALRTNGWNLEEVKAGTHSGQAPSVTSANSSNARALKTKLQRTEPCFITKRFTVTHERAHWVNAIRDDPYTKRIVEKALITLGIVHDKFHLNSMVNLTNLDRMLHASLDKYAAIAVTGTPQSLDFLINEVIAQNEVWQQAFNKGRPYIRQFDTLEASYTGLQYELVLLLPEHLLPTGMDLTFYNRVNDTIRKKYYVVGPDHVLREDPGTVDSPRLPPFTFDARGGDALNLNPFLVILNAEIKFRRYIRQGHHTRLSPDVQQLMEKTCELVQLIYWKPTEATNEEGRQRRIAVDCMDVDSSSVSSSDPADMSEFGFLDDKGAGGSTARPLKRRHIALVGPAERPNCIQYLLSGHDRQCTQEDNMFLQELDVHHDGEQSLYHSEEVDALDRVRPWVETGHFASRFGILLYWERQTPIRVAASFLVISLSTAFLTQK